MKEVCLTDLKAALKGQLPKEDIQDLADELKSRANARMMKRLESKAEALNKSVDELLKEREVKAKLTKLRTYKNIEVFRKAREQINLYKTGEGEERTAKGVEAFFGRRESDVKSSHFSVINRMDNVIKDYMSSFYTDLDKENLIPYFTGKNSDELIGRELGAPGSTGEPHAAKIAVIVKKYQDNLKKALNAEGMAIGEAEWYIARMQHNSDQLKSVTGSAFKDMALKAQLLIKHKGDYVAMNSEWKEMAYQNWKNTISPIMDRSVLEDVDDEEKFMRSFYDATSEQVRKRFGDDGSLLNYRMGMNVGNKMAKPRIIKFSTPEGWITYNKRYGYGSVRDAILSQFMNQSRVLGLVRVLGTNYELMGQKIISWAEGKARGETDPRWESWIKNSRNTLNFITKPPGSFASGMVGELLGMLRNFTYATSSGNIVPNSIPDLGILASFMSTEHNVPALKTYQTVLGNLAKGMPKEELKQVGLALKIYADHSMGNLFQKFGAENSLYGRTARFVEMNMKWAGVEWWDSVTKATAGHILSSNLYEQLPKAFDQLHLGEQHALTIEGIGREEWGTLQKLHGKIEPIGEHHFLFPDHVDQLDEATIRESVGRPLSDYEVRQYKQNLREVLMNYFTDQSSYGKIMPDASDMAFMMMGSNADSPGGKLWRMITMFKSFHVAATRRTLARFIYGKGADNLYDAIRNGKIDYYGMGQYLIHSTMMGYLSKSAIALLAGKSLPDLTDKKEWLDIMNQGGAFFLYGQILLNDYNRHQNFLEQAAGPGIAKIEDLIELVYRSEKKVFGEAKPDSSMALKKNLLSFTRRQIPMLNFFYSKTLVDHAFYNAWMNEIDPNYTYKLRQRAEKNNQHYLWNP